MALTGTLDELLAGVEDEKIKKGLLYLKSLGHGFMAGKGPGHLGRTEIDEETFALHQVYETRPPSEAKYEAHRRYVDIQFIISGEEMIRIAKLEGQDETVPYDVTKDVAFYSPHRGGELLLTEGHAAIFYPKDIHAPCLDPASGRKMVKKTVVKVLI